MNEGDAIELDRSLWKFTKIFQIFGAELIARPFRCDARDGIEVLGISFAGYRFIVIAANGDFSETANFVDDLIWIGAIADDVTETERTVPSAFGGCKGSVERSLIRVNIAQNQESHAAPI